MICNKLFAKKMSFLSGKSKEAEQSNSTNLDGFKLYRILGKGAYAKVRVAVKKDTGELYAIKCFNKQHIVDKKAVNTVINERKLLEQICHPFCVYMHWAFQTDDDLYMVMNLLQGGDLRFHLSRKLRLSQHKARFYIAQVVLALEYLHSINIVHRDVKPENIGIDNKGNGVLMDMGLARKFTDGQQFHDKTGTAAYMAPEVWSGTGYGKEADWWSLGVTVYELLTGQLPLELNKEDYRKGIILTEIEYPNYLHKETVDFIGGLLEVNTFRRLGCGELGVDAIRHHPFFEGLAWDKLFNGQLQPPFIPKSGVAYCEPNLDVLHPSSKKSGSPRFIALYDQDIFSSFDYNTFAVNNNLEPVEE